MNNKNALRIIKCVNRYINTYSEPHKYVFIENLNFQELNKPYGAKQQEYNILLKFN